MIRNHRGLTIIELIGSLVLLSILIGLIATTVAIFIRSSNESIRNTKIQTEGLLLVRTIESRINTERPNEVLECDENEDFNGISFQQDKCYLLRRNEGETSSIIVVGVLDDSLNSIVVGDIIFINNLSIDTANVRFETFDNDNVIINFNIILSIDEDDGRPLTFRSSNLFRID